MKAEIEVLNPFAGVGTVLSDEELDAEALLPLFLDRSSWAWAE